MTDFYDDPHTVKADTSKLYKLIEKNAELNRQLAESAGREARLREVMQKHKNKLADFLCDEDIDEEKLNNIAEGMLPVMHDEMLKALEAAEDVEPSAEDKKTMQADLDRNTYKDADAEDTWDFWDNKEDAEYDKDEAAEAGE